MNTVNINENGVCKLNATAVRNAYILYLVRVSCIMFSGCLKGDNAAVLHGKHAVEALCQFIIVGNDDKGSAQFGLQFKHQV